MADATIVGGGPAGLTAALYLEKNGHEATVVDAGETWMERAHLFNYPGIGSMDGAAIMEVLRAQVDAFGAERVEGEVADVAATDDGFVAETADQQFESDYLILATGADRDLAESLGCSFDGDVVEVDLSMETSVEDAYATGAMIRPQTWQAVISAGDAAAAALDVISKEKGERYHDFDTPDEALEVFSQAE